MREGDTLVVWKLSRLARSLTQMISMANYSLPVWAGYVEKPYFAQKYSFGASFASEHNFRVRGYVDETKAYPSD